MTCKAKYCPKYIVLGQNANLVCLQELLYIDTREAYSLKELKN